MKIMTEKEFKKFVERDDWKRTQHIIIEKTFREERSENPKNRYDFEIEHVSEIIGQAYLISELDGVKIVHNTAFGMDAGRPETFYTEEDSALIGLFYRGVTVVCEDGEEAMGTAQYLPDAFFEIDYSELF